MDADGSVVRETGKQSGWITSQEFCSRGRRESGSWMGGSSGQGRLFCGWKK